MIDNVVFLTEGAEFVKPTLGNSTSPGHLAAFKVGHDGNNPDREPAPLWPRPEVLPSAHYRARDRMRLRDCVA